jgi:hypothetical protein
MADRDQHVLVAVGTKDDVERLRGRASGLRSVE